MPSNPFTRAQIIDSINSIIGTTLSTTWTDAKINLLIDNALSEISEAVPFIMMDTYPLETRRGIATSTLANNLVDATNAYFLAGDVGKVIYNTTDRTWTTIRAYTSTTTVVLHTNIMASGEGYEIYNKECWNNRQINIEEVGDFLSIIGAIYPIEPSLDTFVNMRSVKVLGNDKILEIDTAWVDNTKNADAYKYVQLYLARQHKLNHMTDLAAATTAAYAAAIKTIALNGLTDADTPISKNTLFYFTKLQGAASSSRFLYRTTADATIGTQAATISFYPGLETAVSSADEIAFIGSTLTPDLERILIDMVTGQILMAEGISQVNAVPVGGQSVSTRTFDMGRSILERARMQLKGLVDVDLRANITWSR